MNNYYKIVTLLLFWAMTGCGSATPAGKTSAATSPNAKPSVEKDGHNQQSAPAKEAVIVENKTVVIPIEEQLRGRYMEMGLPTDLADVLANSKIELIVPDSFEGVLPTENEYWTYDYGLLSKSGKVEIRIKILPGENDTRTAQGMPVTTKNELMNLLIVLNGANLVADIQDHPKSEAASRFNADSYTTGTIQPVPGFSERQIASAGLVYRAGAGRIIIVALMDDIADEETRTEWITGANAIRFWDGSTGK